MLDEAVLTKASLGRSLEPCTPIGVAYTSTVTGCAGDRSKLYSRRGPRMGTWDTTRASFPVSSPISLDVLLQEAEACRISAMATRTIGWVQQVQDQVFQAIRAVGFGGVTSSHQTFAA